MDREATLARRAAITYGSALLAGGLLAGCTGDGGSGTSTDVATDSPTATDTEAETATPTDTPTPTAHLPWEPHDHPKESLDAIQEVREARQAGEYAEYVIRPTESEDGAGEFAGTTGIYPKWDHRTVTFGIWLRPQFWGRGYSGERAAAVIEIAFDHLGLEVVAVAHMDGNEKSRRAVEKYVDRFDGQHEGLLRNFQVNDDGAVVDMHRYTITRKQYENATTGENA